MAKNGVNAVWTFSTPTGTSCAAGNNVVEKALGETSPGQQRFLAAYHHYDGPKQRYQSATDRDGMHDGYWGSVRLSPDVRAVYDAHDKAVLTYGNTGIVEAHFTTRWRDEPNWI